MRELHRTAHALRHVDERAVREDGRVEAREEVVRDRHDRAEVLADEVGVIADRLGERAEDDARLLELRLERGRDRDAVEDGVDRDAGERRALVQRHPELLVGLEQLGVDLVQALRRVLPLPDRRVVRDRLVVDRLVADVRPARLLHGEPVAEGLEPPFGHPLGLALHGREPADDGLVETGRERVLLDVGDEAGLVLGLRDVVERRAHGNRQPINLYLKVKIRRRATRIAARGRGRTPPGQTSTRFDGSSTPRAV